MKSQFVRLALLSAIALTSPLLTFAGGQPNRVRMLTQSEMRNVGGVTRAVQQGKGTGVQVPHADARHSQTPVVSGAVHPKTGDSAFNK